MAITTKFGCVFV